ncbi:MAG: DUF721 domain-containing protein [Crocinitomicaceae bacterium]|nr:DUF721 domain-containing protein [Crocinitomicaceae bacterium]
MDEFKRNKNQSSIGEVIDKLMKAYQLDGKLKEVEVISKWEEMMGRAVFLRTKNIYIKNRILYLSIDSSVMREELVYGKSVIIQRVNEAAGFEMIHDVWLS